MSRNELSGRRASVSRHDVALVCNAKRTSGESLVVSAVLEMQVEVSRNGEYMGNANDSGWTGTYRVFL